MIAYVIAPAFGLVLGAIELGTRFRGDPGAVFRCFSAYVYLAIHGFMAFIAFVLVLQFSAFLKPDTIPAAITANPLLLSGFCGLTYGALLRSKFLDIKSPDGSNKSVGLMWVFDRVLDLLERPVQTAHFTKINDKITAILKDRNLDLLPQLIVSNLGGFPSLNEKKKKEIAAAAKDFDEARKKGVPAAIAIGALAHVVIDTLGIRTFENLVKNAP